MTNYYKVQQLVEQSTTSDTFVNVPSATLTFTPANVGQVWVVFASGVCRSSSTFQQSFEMRLTIGGVERDLWSHQNANSGTPNGAGFMIFDRITGVASLQTVALQYRATAGTVSATTIRVVAFLVPANADFQYFASDAIVASTGANIVIDTLAWSPPTDGDYIICGSVKHREFPSGSTSQAWFEDVGASLHPDAPVGTHHSNARDAWNPLTSIWSVFMAAGTQTINIRFTSSLNGAQSSQHRYRKIMAFRRDAWDLSDYDLSATESTTTGGTWLQKNTLTTAVPPQSRDYVSLQCARISGDSTLGTVRKAGELRIGGSAVIRTDHRITRNGSNTQGYHHIIGVCDARNESAAVTYANGFLSPNGATIQCAESVIVVLRYPGGPTQRYQMMM